MSYLVLARKYRPRTFSEVTGQEVVTRTLQGAIAEKRVAHAYLLCGPRGTGKTTTARIFAKALNCDRGPTPEPCGECERCRAADSGSEVDLVEIDAASHTSVEDVRLLREQAAYVPMRARFKIYLIDEVHMLSRSAFNALLKTLEEPPSHVQFLFATTEQHKVPDTILSRCQVLKLAPLSETAIAARLREIFSREGVRAEAGVEEALARRARGGMRDALSLADQLLAMVGDEPQLDHVRRLSGSTDREALGALLEKVRVGDRPAVLTLLPAGEGGETELVEALLAHLRDGLLLAHCGLETPLVEQPAEAREGMAAFVRGLGLERSELWLEELVVTRERMRELPSQARLLLELALLRLARPIITVGIGELSARLLALEEGSVGSRAHAPERAGPPPSAADPAKGAEKTGAVIATSGAGESRTTPPPNRQLRASPTEAWRGFLDALTRAAPSLAEVLGRCGRLVDLSGAKVVVRLEGLRSVDRALVSEVRNQNRCSQVFSELLGEPIQVELVDPEGLRPGREDPFTRQVADLFGGRIED